jgi:hypothetical protein
MPIEMPRRFTQAWIEGHVPDLSPEDAEAVFATMRAKGWTRDELTKRVLPLLPAASADHILSLSRSRPTVRHTRRRRVSLGELSAIAGIVGSIAAVLALFSPFGHEGSGKSTPKSPTLRSTVQASAAAQNTLLQHIPPAVRGTCAANDSLRRQFSAVAGVRCSISGADQVAYFSYANLTAMEHAYEPTTFHVAFGNCATHWAPFPHVWWSISVPHRGRRSGSAVGVGGVGAGGHGEQLE